MSLHHNTAFLSDTWSQRFKLPPGGEKNCLCMLCFYWHGWTNFTLLKLLMIPSTHAFKLTSKLSNPHLTKLLFSHGDRKRGTDNCRILISIFSPGLHVVVYLMFSFHRSDCKGRASFFHVIINSIHTDATGIFCCTCVCGVLEANPSFMLISQTIRLRDKQRTHTLHTMHTKKCGWLITHHFTNLLTVLSGGQQ